MRTVIILAMLLLAGCQHGPAPAPSAGIVVTPVGQSQPDLGCAEQVRRMRESGGALALPERYRDLRVIDAHNHGADGQVKRTLDRADTYFVDRTVLFGKISEPGAQQTDKAAFAAYRQTPGRVYPFFAGIPLEEERGAVMAREMLEQGFYGIGEIVGASTYSPATAKLAWKAKHPNSGCLPELYHLSAEYHAPVLLHIDPPTGAPIEKLEQALEENPDAILIFAHANAYNTPENIERLVGEHPNLMIDFFAGFTAYNLESTYSLADFAPLMEQYPERFLISTDSGYGVGEEQALLAMIEMIDLLTPETACRVAHQNFEAMIEKQAATETQVAKIAALSKAKGLVGARSLNKREANELIFQLEGE